MGLEPAMLVENLPSAGLHIATLFVVSACVTVLLGFALMVAWIQDRGVRAIAWWSAAYLIGGSAIAFWTLQGSAILPGPLPGALLFIAGGLVWNGARLFQGRRVLLLPVFAGVAAWLLSPRLDAVTGFAGARVVLAALLVSGYSLLIAFEFGRERRRTAFSHWLAILLPVLHGAIFLLPVPFIVLAPGPAGSLMLSSRWFAAFAIEALLYAVGTAFTMLFMAKERAEEIHKTAARTDPLTGLFNRRAFFEAAEPLLARQARKRRPISVLMFDLDHFKSINDGFGHGVGDDALRQFAKTVGTTMRAGDIVARLGGEEFVAILPNGLADAQAAAERVRAAFETAGREISGHRLGATVSIGVACAITADADIHGLLGAADAALYRAKAGGRNRVEAVESALGMPVSPDPGVPSVPAAPVANDRETAPLALAS
jgi:diguanylate cyclase (GGDEF)-like protein